MKMISPEREGMDILTLHNPKDLKLNYLGSEHDYVQHQLIKKMYVKSMEQTKRLYANDILHDIVIVFRKYRFF